MHKIYIVLFFIFYTTFGYSSSPEPSDDYVYYYVFIIQKKINTWCQTDTSFQTLILPTSLSYEDRQNIVSKRKKKFEKTENFKLKVECITLKKSEYLAIYKVKNKNKVAGCSHFETYKAVRANTKEEIKENIHKKLEVSFTKEYFVSYTIATIQEPLANKNPNYLEKLFRETQQFIRELNATKDSITPTNPAVGIGTRG